MKENRFRQRLEKATLQGVFFFYCTGIERPLRKQSCGLFLGRGRFPWLSDASRRGVDGSQFGYRIYGCTQKDIHQDVLFYF
mgnify:CR=1 FL=1